VSRLTGLAAALTLTAAVLTGCGGSGSSPGGGSSSATSTREASTGTGGKITIAWAQWKPSDYLQTLSKNFTKETGIAVDVVQIPWSDYQTKIQTGVWTGRSDAYDLIVGDSQWLGRGATEGHYVDLTDWAKSNVPWHDIPDNLRKFYCEYDGKIWGVPCEADAIGFAYRKDLFNNPAEQQAFKAKYHYDLAAPTSWDHFRDIAQFFTRPEQKLYGAALFYAGGGSYDGITMGFDQVLWCDGGDLRDPRTDVVQGVINSPTAVKALAFYTQELKKYTPPGSENYYYNECLKAFQSGQVAMSEDWYTFFPGLTDRSQNPLLDKTGFFVSPAGPAGHYISLGGQGISISAYSKNQDNAKKFLAWFSKKDTQQKWADLGGITCNTAVMATPDFKKAAPFNEAFAGSAPFLRDFYNNPKYADLLEATQVHWNKCVTGAETPQQAMDAIAAKHTTILKDAGLLK
jgi:multiple sugar transport system substrate-binding protein